MPGCALCKARSLQDASFVARLRCLVQEIGAEASGSFFARGALACVGRLRSVQLNLF